jgi:hypothetical protein
MFNDHRVGLKIDLDVHDPAQAVERPPDAPYTGLTAHADDRQRRCLNHCAHLHALNAA